MQAKTVKEVLIAAKWILENNNWCRAAWAKAGPNDFGNNYLYLNSSDNKLVLSKRPNYFCVSGAIRAVNAERQLKANAESMLGNLCGDPCQNILHWNDAMSRTKSQVIALLNRAIKKSQ